jgi:hypothetical protein
MLELQWASIGTCFYLHQKEPEILTKMTYHLKYDKTGLKPFCFTAPDMLMVKKCIQEFHLNMQWQQSNPETVPHPLSAHRCLWTEIPYYKVLWYTTTKCSVQTVALYWGLYFFLKTFRHMGGDVVYKNLFPNWTINLHIPFKVRDFLTRGATVSFSERTLFPELVCYIW